MARHEMQVRKSADNQGEHQRPALDTALRERIAKRAYQLFQARGGQPGHELEDWVQAERAVTLARK